MYFARFLINAAPFFLAPTLWTTCASAQEFCSVTGGSNDRRIFVDQTAMACVDSAGICYSHDLQVTRLRVRFWIVRDSEQVPGVNASQLDAAFAGVESDYAPWQISFERLPDQFIQDDYLMNNIGAMAFDDVVGYVKTNERES